MKPLIKYTGGKYNEYKDIKDFFPSKINNYFEPFFGGGGVFFRLCNDHLICGTSHINDFSDSLIEFYECVSKDGFKDELIKISDMWNSIKDFSEKFYTKYGDTFKRLMISDKTDIFITSELKKYVEDVCNTYIFNTHGFSLYDRIIKSLNDKLSRFRKKNISEEEQDVPYKCITTCICQAFYFIIRDMYNDWNNRGHKDLYTKEERSAQWVFIREFCFGSMFRFGPDGDFNVPYGGYSYNNKCFKSKVDIITSEEVKNLFKTTNIECGDFEDFIKKYSYGEDDFMFLDPPYDSTFTDYDGNGFGRDEHIRLHKVLSECKCKWLMDIGKTDFIYDLYKDFNIVEIDKTYMYQARGTYDNKHTSHLIITNYNPGKLF